MFKFKLLLLGNRLWSLSEHEAHTIEESWGVGRQNTLHQSINQSIFIWIRQKAHTQTPIHTNTHTRMHKTQPHHAVSLQQHGFLVSRACFERRVCYRVLPGL